MNKKYVPLLHVLVCALVFFVTSMPFRLLFSALSVVEVRPSAMLPPVFGLFLGPYGALGAALGNLAADILSGYRLITCAGIFVFQFLYGYIPYILWHSVFLKNRRAIQLGSVRDILKYSQIILLNSLLNAFLTALFLEALGVQVPMRSVAFFMFFNNFIFCMTLGIPLVTVLKIFGTSIYAPLKKSGKTGNVILLIVSAGTGFIYFLYSFFRAGPVNRTSGIILCIFCFLCALLGTFLFPLEAKITRNPHRWRKPSLSEQTTLAFLLPGVLAVFIIALTIFNERRNELEPTALWNELYFNTGVSLCILFGLILTILRIAERSLVVPIERLSKIISSFASSGHTPEENQLFIDHCRKVECSNEQIRVLSKSMVKTIVQISNYTENIKRITAEQEHSLAELQIACDIQTSILPSVDDLLLGEERFDLFPLILPAKEVSGDFYDFFLVDRSHLAMIIADVSGKGVPAALFMMISKTLIREYSLLGLPPSKVFALANERLEKNISGMFVTAFMAVVDLETGEFVYVNSGHNYPVFKRAGGSFEVLRGKSALVIGGLENTVYEEESIFLNPEDVLLLYTDGVTEAMNSEMEPFSDERFLKTLNQHKDLSMKDLTLKVKSSVEAFTKGNTQSDDITMLGFVYKGNKQSTTILQ